MKILQEIKPSKKEADKANKNVSSFIRILEKRVPDCKIVLGGSFAKDTWLSGNHDIDIFIRFPYNKYKNKDISGILKDRLGNIKFDVIHGSRDYFQIRNTGFKFELIPVLNIKNAKEAKNITDLSPFHTLWVKENSKSSDEIRLAKKFIKENDLYGAETHIKGFSGYTIEILTAYYGTFFDFIKNASEWKDKEAIDIEKHYKNKESIVKKINNSRLSNLIVIDPVQKERNTSAALSTRNYLRFIKLCKDYMKNPSEDFFVRKKINFKEIKNSYNNSKVVVLKIKPLIGKEDISCTKVLKVLDYINNKLKQEGFTVHDYDVRWNEKIRAWFIIKDEKLSKYRKHYGPPIKEESHLKLFMDKWKNHNVKEEGNRIYVEVLRNYKDAKDFLKKLIKKDDVIKSNVRKIKIKVI